MIPRIIHQIWLGNQSRRPQRWLDSVQEMHSDWEYHLWTEENLPLDLKVKRQCGVAYRKGELNKVSDFLRYELLHRFGGIHLDADMWCLRSFEPLLQNTFFIAEEFNPEENLYPQFPSPYLTNCVMGSVKGGEVIRALLEGVLEMDEEYIRDTQDIVCAGPVYVTHTLNRLGKRSDVTIYDSHHFYPHHPLASYGSSRDAAQAYGIHQWGNTWGYKRGVK